MKLRQTVLSVGTVLLGQTSDQEQAEQLARQFMPYQPYWVKDARPIYALARRPPLAMQSSTDWNAPTVEQIGETYTYFIREEQVAKNSRSFRNLQQFHFLVGQSKREGELPTALSEISIEDLDPNQYQTRAMTDPIRESLARRDGQKVRVLLEEIDQHSGGGTRTKPVHQSPANPVRIPPITRRPPVTPPEPSQEKSTDEVSGNDPDTAS